MEIEFEGQAFRRLPVRQETDRLGVLLAQPVIAGMALLPFVTARDPACKADAQRVGERYAQETFSFNRIEPAVGQRSTGRQTGGGIGRDHVDSAAGSILDEQRALRRLENLEPLEIARGTEWGCGGREG